jgi:alginate O-acetyltransferase complex protein AlgI
MLFNSLQFLFFFITVTCLYFALPHRFRWLMLLIASCWFYMAFIPVYLLILIFTIVIDYYAGILIENASIKQKKKYLIVSLLANIGVLVIFKYFNFFIENFNQLLTISETNFSLPALKIILPIGLSFHTFQAMSYTIEVYKGRQRAERHFGIYALYVMFYPQLVAGPIERPQNILHQMHEKHSWDFERVKNGLLLILWGLFKKIVIADRLALVVDAVYDNPTNHSSLNILFAVFFFSFQIYCDFSGYSTIAIGTAKVIGFDLMENFKTPYFSKSISEFWSRWHISLSTWFRDYLYIPLGGNRVSAGRLYCNLMIVFLVSGFWHGASWGFIVWGALHGCFLILALIRSKYFPGDLKIHDFFHVVYVFFLVSFAWIFFRSGTLATSRIVIERLFEADWTLKHFDCFEIIYSFLLIALLCIIEFKLTKINKSALNRKFYLIAASLIFLIYFLGIFRENQFIYFQF